MLILRRRQGEQVAIGEGDDRVVLTVLEVRPNSRDVNLGFEGPDRVPVDRIERAERGRRDDRS